MYGCLSKTSYIMSDSIDFTYHDPFYQATGWSYDKRFHLWWIESRTVPYLSKNCRLSYVMVLCQCLFLRQQIYYRTLIYFREALIASRVHDNIYQPSVFKLFPVPDEDRDTIVDAWTAYGKQNNYYKDRNKSGPLIMMTIHSSEYDYQRYNYLGDPSSDSEPSVFSPPSPSPSSSSVGPPYDSVQTCDSLFSSMVDRISYSSISI